MPTMGESPEAEAVLHEIKPNEVSAVDVPANGEPFIVLKGMNSGSSNRLDKSVEPSDAAGAELNQTSETVYDDKPTQKNGGVVMATKLDATQVPRRVMKVVHKRMSDLLDEVRDLQDVVKRFPAKEDGSDKAPLVLVETAKSISAGLRSLLPDAEVPVQKRINANSVLSLQKITKREEDIEKANAVSYLVRDRWASVSQSISEYMTTYVQGVESDDAGPMLIPVDTDETVTKSADELDKLVDETGEKAEDVPSEPEPVAKRKDDMTVSQAFGMIIEEIRKLNHNDARSPGVGEDGGSNMSGTTTTKSTDAATGGEETQTQPTEAPTDKPVETTTPTATTTDKPTESTPAQEPAAKGADPNDRVLAAIAAMEKKFDTQFDEVRTEIKSVRGVAEGAAEKVDKALHSRADSRGAQPQATTKTKATDKPTETEEEIAKRREAEGSFKDVLGIPK